MPNQIYMGWNTGDVVKYDPSLVKPFNDPLGPDLKHSLCERGLQPGVDYTVLQAFVPTTQRDLTSQRIEIMVDGRRISVNGAFFVATGK